MIVSYSTKPEPLFQRRNQADSSHTFGVELEIEDGRSRDQLVNELDRLGLPIYQKLDGSLHECGLEIITHPGTLAWHRYTMRWAEVSRLCRALGWHSDDSENCGLHIHVGRATLGDTIPDQRLTAAKLVLLVNALWDNGLVTFTRRKPRELEWCNRPRIRDVYGVVALRDEALRAGGQGLGHSARYTAVNLTNTGTVEFRIFKGTLKRERLMAAMELVDTLIHYAMHHTLPECDDPNLTLAEVVTYGGYGTSYKELVKECQRLGLLPAESAE